MQIFARIRRTWTQGIRHRVTLLGAMILALLLASGLLAFATAQNAFFLLFSLLLASVLVSSFINRLMLAGLSAELQLPAHPMAGEELPSQLRLRNDKSLLSSFALSVRTPEGPTLHVPVLPPRSVYQLELNCRWEQRGLQKALEIVLETRFPFGYSIRRTVVRVAVPEAIYPPIHEPAGGAAILRGLIEAERQASWSGTEEFSHLRQYQAGDAARQIAWTASARLAASEPPLVRALSGASEQGLQLRLDLGSPHFEALVQLAAYLLWELQYRNLGCVFRMGPEEFTIGNTVDAYTVLKQLALVKAEPEAPLPHDVSSFLLSYRPGYLPAPGTEQPGSDNDSDDGSGPSRKR